jgi:hypothetical protein
VVNDEPTVARVGALEQDVDDARATWDQETHHNFKRAGAVIDVGVLEAHGGPRAVRHNQRPRSRGPLDATTVVQLVQRVAGDAEASQLQAGMCVRHCGDNKRGTAHLKQVV